MEKVSVILPAYNEKDNVVPLIREIDRTLAGRPHEIILVDDDSPDGTFDAVMALQISTVRALVRKHEPGLANSIRHGIDNSTGDIVVVMDSDFNHNPAYLPFMLDAIRYYDCVTATRFQYGGGMESRARNTLSWLFNIFVRVMTAGMITDSLYGYFAIRRAALMQCPFDKIFWGYGDYCIRLFYYLQQHNTSVLQFPALNGQRRAGTGNSRFFRVFLKYSWSVVRLVWSERILGRV